MNQILKINERERERHSPLVLLLWRTPVQLPSGHKADMQKRAERIQSEPTCINQGDFSNRKPNHVEMPDLQSGNPSGRTGFRVSGPSRAVMSSGKQILSFPPLHSSWCFIPNLILSYTLGNHDDDQAYPLSPSHPVDKIGFPCFCLLKVRMILLSYHISTDGYRFAQP